jgi:16S rRNA (guanine527-N7)-methyltransferase
MRDEALARELANGIEAMALSVPAEAQHRMLAFIMLLAKWNRTFNLTAIDDPVQMVGRHLLDSLAVLPYLRGPRVLDVGTGAGLPGIPPALARPTDRFVLLDSIGKKTRFVTQAVAELGLDNVEVVQARLAEYRPAQAFDCVISRAFGALAELLQATGSLLAPGGRLLAMKGKAWREELDPLAPGSLIAAHRLNVPGAAGQRYLVELAPPPQ